MPIRTVRRSIGIRIIAYTLVIFAPAVRHLIAAIGHGLEALSPRQAGDNVALGAESHALGGGSISIGAIGNHGKGVHGIALEASHRIGIDASGHGAEQLLAIVDGIGGAGVVKVGPSEVDTVGGKIGKHKVGYRTAGDGLAAGEGEGGLGNEIPGRTSDSSHAATVVALPAGAGRSDTGEIGSFIRTFRQRGNVKQQISTVVGEGGSELDGHGRLGAVEGTLVDRSGRRDILPTAEGGSADLGQLHREGGITP